MKELLNKGGFDSFSMQTSVVGDEMSSYGSTVADDGTTLCSSVASDGMTLYGASSYGGTSYGTESQTNLSVATHVRFVLNGFLYLKVNFYNVS